MELRILRQHGRQQQHLLLQESQFQPLQRPAWKNTTGHRSRNTGSGKLVDVPAPLPPSSSMVHADELEASKGSREDKKRLLARLRRKKKKHMRVRNRDRQNIQALPELAGMGFEKPNLNTRDLVSKSSRCFLLSPF